MPAKGELYNKIGIRLEKWLTETMQKLGRNKSGNGTDAKFKPGSDQSNGKGRP